MFVEASDTVSKLELIDSVSKLGLDRYFMEEIKEALDAIALRNSSSILKGDLYATALCFRLLRHYGYHASQGACMKNYLREFLINLKYL